MNTHTGEEILAALLIELDIGTAPQDAKPWPVFIVLPNKPDEAIAVVNVVGDLQGRIQRTGEFILFEGIQVRTRSHSWQSARLKLRDVLSAMEEVKKLEITVENSRYLIWGVHLLRPPAAIGEDENDRKNFTADFKLKAKEV